MGFSVQEPRILYVCHARKSPGVWFFSLQFALHAVFAPLCSGFVAALHWLSAQRPGGLHGPGDPGFPPRARREGQRDVCDQGCLRGIRFRTCADPLSRVKNLVEGCSRACAGFVARQTYFFFTQDCGRSTGGRWACSRLNCCASNDLTKRPRGR